MGVIGKDTAFEPTDVSECGVYAYGFFSVHFRIVPFVGYY